MVVRGAERMEERARPRGLARARAGSMEQRRADIEVWSEGNGWGS